MWGCGWKLDGHCRWRRGQVKKDWGNWPGSQRTNEKGEASNTSWGDTPPTPDSQAKAASETPVPVVPGLPATGAEAAAAAQPASAEQPCPISKSEEGPRQPAPFASGSLDPAAAPQQPQRAFQQPFMPPGNLAPPSHMRYQHPQHQPQQPQHPQMMPLTPHPYMPHMAAQPGVGMHGMMPMQPYGMAPMQDPVSLVMMMMAQHQGAMQENMMAMNASVQQHMGTMAGAMNTMAQCMAVMAQQREAAGLGVPAPRDEPEQKDSREQ